MVEAESKQYSSANEEYPDRQADLSIQWLASELFKPAGHRIRQLELQIQNNHNKLTLKYFRIVCIVRQQIWEKHEKNTLVFAALALGNLGQRSRITIG